MFYEEYEDSVSGTHLYEIKDVRLTFSNIMFFIRSFHSLSYLFSSILCLSLMLVERR